MRKFSYILICIIMLTLDFTSIHYASASGKSFAATQTDNKITWQTPYDNKYNYVIITTDNISSSGVLDAFISHKRNMGFSALVVTESQWGKEIGEAPNHRAEKIRKWLQKNYQSMSIKYVLLIGDPSPFESGEGDIPMKMCWTDRFEDTSTPTDYYYANLTGSWDADEDGYFGEYNEILDKSIFQIDVVVGRIPVYKNEDSIVRLHSILQKTITYESDNATSWRKNALLTGSFIVDELVKYDGADFCEALRKDILINNGFSNWLMYQQGDGPCGDDSQYPSNESLTVSNRFLDRWSQDHYGMVAWVAHGSNSYAYVGSNTCSGSGPFIGSYFSLDNLDDGHPSFVFTMSCDNGWPEDKDNLAYCLLKRGAIASVASTREVAYNFASRDFQNGGAQGPSLLYNTIQRVVNGEPVGDALYYTKRAAAQFYELGWNPMGKMRNLFGYSLYGDPSVSLYPPAKIQGKLVFVSDRNDKNNEIYSMNLDGTNLKRLTSNSSDDICPEWSPDGSKIVFVSNRNGNNRDIYIMADNGTILQRLTDYSGDDMNPHWSPDGKWIAYCSNRGGSWLTFKCEVANPSNNIPLTTVAQANNVDAHWSPEGNRLVFASNRTGPQNLWIMDKDGNDQHNISNVTSAESGPDWSPDGTKISFASNRLGHFELYTMLANGDNQTRLFESPFQEIDQTCWTNWGIVFAADRKEIYLVDVNSKALRNLTNNSSNDLWPDVWPRPLAITAPSVVALPCTDPSYHTATIRGNLVDKGMAPSCNVSFRWGLYSGNYPFETAINPTSGTGMFQCPLTNLSENTTYHYIARAEGLGENWSDDQCFTTFGRFQKQVIFRTTGTNKGMWYVDNNLDGYFSPAAGDQALGPMGTQPGDVPVAIEWNTDGRQEMAIYRPSNGMWYIDNNNSGRFELGVDPMLGPFGTTPGDIPLAIDWDGDGRQEMAIFRTQGLNQGRWYIDINHTGKFESGADIVLGPFGTTAGDKPVAIDWNGDGRQELCIFRTMGPNKGMWYIDINHTGTFEPGSDPMFGPFGKNDGDIPFAYDINYDGKQEMGIFRPSNAAWYFDVNRDGIFIPGVDAMGGPFGSQPGDTPLLLDNSVP